MHGLLKSALSIILGVLLMSCQTTTMAVRSHVQQVSLAPGEYSSVAWVADRTVVIEREDPRDPRMGSQRLSLVMLDAPQDERPLALAKQGPGCRVTEYHQLKRLPTGELGAVRICAREKDVEGDTVDIVAIGVDAARIRPLLNTPAESGISGFTFGPDLQRGLISAGGEICETIVAVEQGEVRPLRVTLGDGKNRWSLDEGDQRSCTSQGRASLPAWSPSGEEIAFFASPDSVGVADFDRLNVPWNLYLSDTEFRSPRPVLTGIRHARELSWSPDGNMLIFTGELAGRSPGTWLFAPKSNSLQLLSKSVFDSIAWAPEGRKIAAVVTSGVTTDDPKSELKIISW